MKHDKIALWCLRKVKVVLVLKALLDFRVLWVAIGKMLRRILLYGIVNLCDFCAAFNAIACVQKEKKLMDSKRKLVGYRLKIFDNL